MLQLVVDATSGHTQVFPMRKKSETADMILKAISKLELADGGSVKKYHSYNAKKQRSKKLLAELESKGAVVTSTASNSLEQNGFFKTRFGTLFAATRAAILESGLPKTLWSAAYLDAIEKANWIPVKQTDGSYKSTNSKIPGKETSTRAFLPFGKHGYVVNTTSRKKKLDDRALKARYLRSTQSGQHLVLIDVTNKTRLIRQEDS